MKKFLEQWDNLTEFGKEVVKLALTLIILVVVMFFAVCSARAAENGTSPGGDAPDELRGPLCGAWEQVRVGEDEGPEVEILTTMAVGIWDSILRSNRLGYVGRWPLTHLRYEKKLPNKDRPHSIVIRTATPEVVTAWDEEGSPRRRGLAQRRFSYRRKCTEGTLIWLRIECIERYPAPNQIECRSPEFYLKVLMHELGHALGLPESTARHSVMYPIISEYDTRIWLGADTRRRLNRYYSAGL